MIVVKNKFSPVTLLKKLSTEREKVCLKVSNGSVNWMIYLEEGSLTYASHSLEPFDRLERHLRRLSNDVPTLTLEVRTELRLNFGTSESHFLTPCSDYKAICWLVEQKYITSYQAARLVERLTKEVIETYLLLSEINHEIICIPDDFTIFSYLDISALIDKCLKELKAWKAMSPKLWSLDQRPYFFSQPSVDKKLSSEQKTKLSKLLRGFSFRQLAALLNQEELRLAKNLYPLIADGTIVLRDPQEPLDKLPKISAEIIAPNPAVDSTANKISLSAFGGNQNKSHLKIACVDDSLTILHQINQFLKEQDLEVFPINDSVKALREIIRIEPNLILLDVGMPNLDGYKLCRMIRNHSSFQKTPIIMVTSNTGLIDRAKAKVAGSTNYMTKPFTESELLAMVFRYLT